MTHAKPLKTPATENNLEKTLKQLSALASLIEDRIPAFATPAPVNSAANALTLLQANQNEELAKLTKEIRGMIQEIKQNDDPELTAQYHRIASILYHTLIDPTNDNRKALRLASKSTALEARGHKIAEYIAHTKNALIGMLSHYFLEITFGAIAMATLGPIAGTIAFLAAREAVELLGLDDVRKPYQEKATKAKQASARFYQATEKLDKLEGQIIKNQKILQDIAKNQETPRRAHTTKGK